MAMIGWNNEECMDERISTLERENSKLKAEVERLVALTKGQEDTIKLLEDDLERAQDQLSQC